MHPDGEHDAGYPRALKLLVNASLVCLPVLMLLALGNFLFHGLGQKQGLGGLMGVGKSRARVYVEHDTQVTFADVSLSASTCNVARYALTGNGDCSMV